MKKPVRYTTEFGSNDPQDHIGHTLYYDAFGIDSNKRYVSGNAWCQDCNWSVEFTLPKTTKVGKLVLTPEMLEAK